MPVSWVRTESSNRFVNRNAKDLLIFFKLRTDDLCSSLINFGVKEYLIVIEYIEE